MSSRYIVVLYNPMIIYQTILVMICYMVIERATIVVEPTYSYCPIVQKHMGCGIQYFIFGISKRYHPKSRHCPSYGSSMWYVYFIHPSSWESKDDGQINPTHTVYIYSIYVYTHNMYIYTNVPIYNNIIHISTDIKHPKSGTQTEWIQ